MTPPRQTSVYRLVDRFNEKLFIDNEYVFGSCQMCYMNILMMLVLVQVSLPSHSYANICHQ